MNIEDYREFCLSLGQDELLRELTRNSYQIVKSKYKAQ